MPGLSAPAAQHDGHERAFSACSWLLLAAVFLFTISSVIWATGGFVTVVAGLRLSARTPDASATGGVLALAAWAAVAWRRRSLAMDLARLDALLGRRGMATAASVATLAGAVAIRFNTFSAGGSDPSGYLSEARQLAAGSLAYVEPLATIADWVEAPRTLAPLGWQAADGALQVPTYAVGLPLLLAVPVALAGSLGAALVIALSAFLSVWFAARMALRLAGGGAALLVGVALATIPVHLYQSMQPMSDVPVTAAWLGCWWWIGRTTGDVTPRGCRSAAWLAGIAAALAVLIRPNLAPLAAVPLAVVWRHVRGQRGAAVLAFAVPISVAAAIVAFLQWRWFGSPLRSGYGTATEIYALANVWPNVRLYWQWLVDTRGAWLLAAPLVLVAPGHRLGRWLLAFAGLVCVAYFVYGTFESWPYLRFLLPAMAVGTIAAGSAIATGVGRLPSHIRAPLLVALTIAIGALQLSRARELDVFALGVRQSRAVLAGQYLASATPASAVLLSGEQSGAMRYYTGRPIVRWDFLDRTALAHVEQTLTSAGLHLWIVLDDWEVALFREKFGATAIGALDWPPVVDAGTIGRVQAWRVRDRASFLRGERTATDRLR